MARSSKSSRNKQQHFLGLEEVLALHNHQIALYGGLDGLRDTGLLQSALAMPQATFGGVLLHGTLAEMAAAYLFHLARNHPFIDGNKRVALASALAFLELNGLDLSVERDELIELVLRVASGSASKAELGWFIGTHLRRLRPH